MKIPRDPLFKPNQRSFTMACLWQAMLLNRLKLEANGAWFK